MNVPLLDLKAQYSTIRGDIEPLVREVMESQYFILGPRVQSCEAALGKYCGSAHAIGVSSGTDALLLALMAEGIGIGDEVITTPYTFFATAGSIARVGAKPVFVDIDPVTFNIDPGLVAKAVTPRTKAIMPVHLYGQMADMDAVMNVARKHGIVVIEDACQAIGAEDKGKRAGAVGTYGCFSFFPSKNLGCFGDGGLVTTQDPKKAEHLEVLRVHGSKPKYYHSFIGGNFRLDALQAVVIEAKLKHLDAWTAARQKNAARYDALFQKAGLVSGGLIRIPRVKTSRHIFNQYVVRAERRDELIEHLRKCSVGVEIYYPVPLHLQACFSYLGHGRGDFPESEKAAAETLALPVYPELSEVQAEYVVESIRGFYAARG